MNKVVLLFFSVGIPLLFSGCGDNRSAFLTNPPKMPSGYSIFYTLPQGASVTWRKPNSVLVDEAPVPLNVLRVGVQKGIIFGIREDPKSKMQSAYYVDTSTRAATLDIPISELNDRLKTVFGITDFETVPARFYDRNSDGGSR